jgi:hypothetical protein
MAFFGIGGRNQGLLRTQLDQTQVSSQEWESAILALEVQFRQHERATLVAQSLLGALTLSAALSAPLLVLGVKRSIIDGIFGLLLLLYLAILGNTIRHCLNAAYLRMRVSESFENSLHYQHISRSCSSSEYVGNLSKQSDEDRLRETQAYAWLVATAMRERRREIQKAIRWTMLSFSFLGLLVVFRFAVAFISS